MENENSTNLFFWYLTQLTTSQTSNKKMQNRYFSQVSRTVLPRVYGINKIKEEEILSMINQYSELDKEFQRRHKGDLQIILLVGETGAGKSTIFNFLAGTQFSFVNDPILGQQLAVSDGSPIGSGATSITTKPYYHFFKQNKHLLIDFPGFSDTRGETEKLLVQLFFHNLVKQQVPVKIVYVLRHPDDDLPERGQKFQEFIKTSFGEENLDICQSSILLNCYNKNLEDEELIERFKYQFKQRYQTFDPKNVFVVRKVKNNEDLQKKFSDQNRQKLLTNLIKPNIFPFKTKYIPHTEIIQDYITEVGNQLIQSYCSLLKQVNVSQIQKKSTLNQLLSLLRQFKAALKDKRISQILSWFQRDCKNRFALTELLQIKWQIIETKNFELVYAFFEDYPVCIRGYVDFNEHIIYVANQIQMKIETINKQIEELEQEEQNRLYQEKLRQYEIQREQERKKREEEKRLQEEERRKQEEERQKLEEARRQQEQARREYEQNQQRWREEERREARRERRMNIIGGVASILLGGFF